MWFRHTSGVSLKPFSFKERLPFAKQIWPVAFVTHFALHWPCSWNGLVPGFIPTSWLIPTVLFFPTFARCVPVLPSACTSFWFLRFWFLRTLIFVAVVLGGLWLLFHKLKDTILLRRWVPVWPVSTVCDLKWLGVARSRSCGFFIFDPNILINCE